MPVPTRRRFLSHAAGVAVAPAIWARQPDADLVIRGGSVVDGLGTAPREHDVVVRGDRIVAIGPRLDLRGREEIDARGRVVAPGFIDIHSHADRALREDPRAESVIRQGVTTLVCGADGGSMATGADESSFTRLWATIGEWAPACNVASMVGLGTVRGAVIGNVDRDATPDEIGRMTDMVARALADGACGASSGLEYTPGAFARPAELAAVCRPLRARGLAYATHMRNEDDRLLEAVDEAIAVGRGANCAVQISHLKAMGTRNWPKLDAVFARIDAARTAGHDVRFDWYPYEAYSTTLTNLFPVWSLEGNVEAFFTRLADPAQGARIKRETLAKVDLIGGWDHVQITSVREAVDRDVEGQRFGTWARGRGLDPYDAAVALLRRNGGNVGMVGFAMDDANLDRLIAHPLAIVCSDGGGFAVDGTTRRGRPHPRGAGTFPRVLGRYVRERRVLSLVDAVRKMTSAPADRLGLRDRGRIAVGAAADLTVFDPATIADRATFADPFQYPVGVSCVIVNGAIALRDDSRTPARTGRPLRPA